MPNPYVLRFASSSPPLRPLCQPPISLHLCITSSFHPSLWPGRRYSSQLLATLYRTFRYGIRRPQPCHQIRGTFVLLGGHVQGSGPGLDMLHGF